jgi:hypothetical protein
MTQFLMMVIGQTRAVSPWFYPTPLPLDTFGPPVGVASATIKDLQTVEGIEASTPADISQVIHGPKPAMK